MNMKRKSGFVIVVWGVFVLTAFIWASAFLHTDAPHLRAAELQAIGAESVEINPIFDTYIAELQPDESWPSANALWVGINLNPSQNVGIRRTLMKFDLSDIPVGSTIASASIEMQVGATTSGDTNMDVYISRIHLNGGWTTEGITWNEYIQNHSVDPEYYAVTQVNSTLSSVPSWIVTEMLGKWIGERPGNNELIVQVRGYEQRDRQRERAFLAADCSAGPACGAKPVLKITYNLPPTVTPTSTATPTNTPTPTSTPTPTATPTSIPHAGVHISVEPVFPYTNTQILPRSIITYTVSIYNITEELSGVKLWADAKIVAGPLTRTLMATGISESAVISDELVGWDIGDIAPGTEASHIYKYSVTVPDGGTLYIPTNYLLNDGATLTWNYPGGSGEARTRPLRNPPFHEFHLPVIRHHRAE